jgi:hypothetical protein
MESPKEEGAATHTKNSSEVVIARNRRSVQNLSEMYDGSPKVLKKDTMSSHTYLPRL